MKKINLSLILPVLLVFAILSISSSTGRNDRRAAAPGDFSGCDGCHSGGTGSVTGTLTGVPSVITPGQTYTLTLSAGDFGSGIAAGFQITASSGASVPANLGTFTASAGTRINPAGRLVQDSPLSYTGGIASWTFDWTAPVQNTYSEVTFFYSINSADLTGGTNNDVTFNGNSANIAVPVQWIYANVEERSRKNFISWGTALEINTDVFVIEKSNGYGEYVKIGEVAAATLSESENHYIFEDENPKEGINYYRIKQIDLDGNYSYSKISQVSNSVSEVRIYPTMVIDVLNIQSGSDNLMAQIFDMNGARKMVVSDATQIDAGNLISGIYIVQITNESGGFVTSERFVKM